MNNTGTYFMHYRRRDSYGEAQPQGGVTLAIRPIGGNVIRVAMAKCGKKDVFNKKLGRAIAEGRLAAAAGSERNKFVYDLVLTETDAPIKEAVAVAFGPAFAEMGLE